MLGWTEPGEWLEYSVYVNQTGSYQVEVWGASAGPGGTFKFQCDGTDIGGTMTFHSTGGWGYTDSVTSESFVLTAGQHVIRWDMLTAGQSGYVAAFDGFSFIHLVDPFPEQLSLSSKSETRMQLPAGIQASHEDAGANSGWLAVDGDSDTCWRGMPGGNGWWLALSFDPHLALNGLHIDWADGSPTNVQYLYSRDADTWFDLEMPITNGAVELNYLWLLFPADEDGAAPGIRELGIK